MVQKLRFASPKSSPKERTLKPQLLTCPIIGLSPLERGWGEAYQISPCKNTGLLFRLKNQSGHPVNI